jgi:hypothetical protein
VCALKHTRERERVKFDHARRLGGRWGIYPSNRKKENNSIPENSLSLLDDEHDDNVEDNRFFTFVLTMMMMMWSSLGLFSSCFSTNATHTRGLFCVVFVQANFGQKKLFRVAVTKSKTTIAYFFPKLTNS